MTHLIACTTSQHWLILYIFVGGSSTVKTAVSAKLIVLDGDFFSRDSMFSQRFHRSNPAAELLKSSTVLLLLCKSVF